MNILLPKAFIDPSLLLFMPLLSCSQMSAADIPFRDPGQEGGEWVEVPEVNTTPGVVALLNLDSRIDGAERTLNRRSRVEDIELLVGLRLTRYQVLNRLSDLDRATEAVKGLPPNSPRTARTVARVMQAQGHFYASNEALDRAAALGAEPMGLAKARAANAVYIGRPSEALELLQRVKSPDLETLFLRASAHAELGALAKADHLFVQALKAYRGLSPFPVAETYFRRGLMWAQKAGRLHLAELMYREGLRILPDHVSMTVEGARVFASTSGELDLAIARLRRLRARTDDPELQSVLAELLASRQGPGDEEGATQSLKLARGGYEIRLHRYREAFLARASEFFRGPGDDPSRASELAEEHLKLFPTQRAHALALKAALATADTPKACRLISELAFRPLTSQPLADLARSTRPLCAGAF